MLIVIKQGISWCYKNLLLRVRSCFKRERQSTAKGVPLNFPSIAIHRLALSNAMRIHPLRNGDNKANFKLHRLYWLWNRNKFKWKGQTQDIRVLHSNYRGGGQVLKSRQRNFSTVTKQKGWKLKSQATKTTQSEWRMCLNVKWKQAHQQSICTHFDKTHLRILLAKAHQ